MCAVILAGVDVSAASFDVCLLEPTRRVAQTKSYPNSPEGRQRFVSSLQSKMGRRDTARVCLESTGVYSVDLSWQLWLAQGVEVMVVNPRAMANFRKAASVRNKTDREDAALALEFLQRMAFEPWQAPAKERMALRQIARRIHDLVGLCTQEKCRLHAATSSSEEEALPELVRRDIAENVQQLEKRIENLRAEALKVIGASEELSRCFGLLVSIKGIAEASGIQILSELAILPEGLKAKQWVAWAGLDPIQFESGTSIKRPSKISRRGSHHLRQALYFPALTAIRCEPEVKQFYQELMGRGKPHTVALVAVMRKLLHSINGMWKHNQPFEGSRFRAPR